MSEQSDPTASLALLEGQPLTASEAQEQTVALAAGGQLIVNKTLTLSVQGISPQLAAHQKELAEIQASNDLQAERIRAETAVKVAEAKHVTPVRIAVRPTWAGLLILGGFGAAALAAGHIWLAGICAGAVGGVLLIGERAPWRKFLGAGKDSGE